MNINLETLALEISGNMSKQEKVMVVRSIFDAIGENMLEGHVVSIPDFGKFKVKESPARTGRNPATGEPIEIAAKKKVVFAPAKALKDNVAD